MGWPSIRAWTWMATLAVEVSFLLFLLLTSVCVYRPASSDALTYISLFSGVLMGAASIVTHPFVPRVRLRAAEGGHGIHPWVPLVQEHHSRRSRSTGMLGTSPNVDDRRRLPAERTLASAEDSDATSREGALGCAYSPHSAIAR